ncbi:MAG: ATP-binding cassette domain-containing protein [Cytophagales bacterium]|nr:MAG: ATP-binding cassette domain-containing protein [Cytophagales bacterium]
MIRTEKISKQYDNHIALQNIDLEIPKGSIFGLLGPNGAGKTTLIRILTQIILPDSGNLYFNNELASSKHQQMIGYLPEERGLYKKMKVFEQLLYLAQLKGLNKFEATKNIDFWMQKLDIHTWKNKTVEELSKGMQQKVQFAATVIHQPQILILDEPFTGFDPINAQMLIEIIKGMKNNGTTIILSSHRMEQTEQLCDSIAMVHQAKIVLQGNLKSIIKTNKKNIYKITFKGVFPENNTLYTILNYEENYKDNIFINSESEIYIQSYTLNLNEILVFLIQTIEILQIIDLKPTLNEIFIEKTT